MVLNATHPNMTRSCWLCYDTVPPYYEGVAVQAHVTISTSLQDCRWRSKQSLTLEQVSGQGLCLGKVPHASRSLCHSTWGIQPQAENSFIIPHNDTWWACSSGLTPCVHWSVLKRSKDYCVLVRLVPRLIYHEHQSFMTMIEQGWGTKQSPIRQKREPITSLTLSLLLGASLGGLGTGVASLVTQSQHYSNLRAAIDADIERLEDSISHLEQSLTSLAEVVLQNRRGLDLIFLQQGGLCVALGEECCFYINHSGTIKDNMAKVREGLTNRKKEREARQNWFESWFNFSPWLTTLVSAIVGPLILLLLAVTIGPCIINRLIAFVKHRINTVQLMVLRAQYQPGKQ